MPPTLKGDASRLEFKRRLRSELSTEPEQRLWYRIRSKQLNSLKFRRQHGIGPYIVDFYCPEMKIIIEIDGETHFTDEQKALDSKREDYLRSLGLKIVRYTNDEIMKNLEGVLEDILSNVKA